MNWFEGDDGFWWNLDHVKTIRPPTNDDTASVEMASGDDYDLRDLTDAEWERLKLQLRDSQAPNHRRIIPVSIEFTKPPEGVKP